MKNYIDPKKTKRETESKEERFKGRKGGIEMEEENKKSSKRAASVDVDGRHGRRALRTRMHTIVS